MQKKELPVFFDQSGKRWRRTKRACIILLVLAIAAAVAFIPPALRPAMVSPRNVHPNAPAPDIRKLEAAFNARNVPVFGRGQFIRAVRIDGGESPSIRDVFTGQYIRALTTDEKLAAETHDYALERYGQLQDHQIALTFDDGPDPNYTPKLLDILSKHHVPAAFFVVGSNVVKHPQIIQRTVREGHTIGNHTFNHIDFELKGTFQADQDIIQTERTIRAVTSHQTAFMRIPYAGDTDEAQRDNIKGILQAQRLGYVETSFDYDSNDWTFKANHHPDPGIFDGHGKVVLLHDSGGDRSHTLSYVEQLIVMAQKAGYTFVNLDQAYPGPPLQQEIAPTLADKTSLALGQTSLVWPQRLMYGLFALSILFTLGITGTNIALAFASQRRAQFDGKSKTGRYHPAVTVLVPAYNEGKVLDRSVRSLLASSYKRLSVVIIDDGSKDDTFAVAKRLVAEYGRVKALHQPNQGKSAALNNGLRHSTGEIVISIDADTLFEPETVERLVRHFSDPSVGAVAGTVRVGNIRNLLTRWQALEYITSIAIERAAQAFLGAIIVVPGACGAWRRMTLHAVGGFSDRTLAEDCDVALSVHETGFRIVQDTSAVSHTECPLTLEDLAKQRFRWIFGNAQSYWKHRQIFFNKRYGWLGSYVLPSAALMLLLPMIFWPLLLVITASNIFAGRWWVIIFFPLAVMAVQAVVALIGLLFAKESLKHLSAVPVTRLVYGPLRTYILYRSLLTVLRGALVGWNKFKRTSTVSTPAPSTPKSSKIKQSQP